jgi:hypothetical protein
MTQWRVGLGFHKVDPKKPKKILGTQMYQPNPLHPEREISKRLNLVFSSSSLIIIIIIIIIINF